jgi:hypothetical protein
MAKSIGRPLAIGLTANTDKFTKGLKGAENNLQKFKNGVTKVGKAVALGFAAMGAGALLFGKNALEAAAQDQKAQMTLARTIKNNIKNQKSATIAIEKTISAIGRQAGISDDKLRPAFSKLIIATKSVNKSQKLMRIAMDISATTGKDLDTVTTALSKGYLGNTTALGKLGLGFDKAELKGRPFDEILGKINEKTKGAAATQAGTYAGTVDKLKVAFGEFMESVGVKLIPIVEKSLKFISDEVAPFVERIGKGFSIGQNGAKTFTDNMYLLGGALGYDKPVSLGLALSDTYTALKNMLGDLNTNGGSGASTLETIASALTSLANGITNVANAFKTLDDITNSKGYQFLLDLIFGNKKKGFAPLFIPNSVLGKANGGMVNGRTPTLVGERGPEVFVPTGGGGRIVPNHRLSGGGGGSNVTINLNGIVDADSARRAIERVLQNSGKRLGPINLVGSTL